MSGFRTAPAARRFLAVCLIGSAAALIGIAPPAARAVTSLYVDGTTGTDVSPCSIGSPCKTIGFALTQAGPGDIINVAAGTYPEHPVVNKAISIVGAGAASTIINAGQTGAAGSQNSALFVNVPPADANQVVSVSGVTITGGFSKFGGGVSLWGGDMTITDATIDGNTAGGISGSTGGGGLAVLGHIFSTSQTLALNHVTVSNNKTVTFTSGTTTTAYPGGGLYAAAPVTATNSTFTGNSTSGAISGSAGGAAYVAKIVAADTPSLTTHATALSGNSSFVGGAIATLAGATTALLDASTVNANSAASGVGMYNAGSTSIVDSSVTNNPATFQGGGVYNASTLTLSNATFTGNTAASAGGAILALATSAITVTGSTLTGNSAPFGGVLFLVDGGTATFTGSTLDNNTATSTGANTTGQGGAIYSQGNLTISGGSVSHNTADSAAGLNGGNGGGILSTGKLTVNGGTTLTGNRAINSSSSGSLATGYGGGIYVGPLAANDAPTATIDGATFDGDGLAANAAVGGALAVVGNVFGAAGTTRAAVTGSGDTFHGNHAVVGGGLFSAGSTTLTNATFTNNAATFEGGAIDAQSTVVTETPSVTLNNPTISTNSGALAGGAAIVFPNATLTVTGGAIDGNDATFGGGVFNSGTTVVDGTTLTNNKANGGTTANAGNGGALYNANVMTVRHATVSGNSANPNSLAPSGSNNVTGWGGGLYAGANAAAANVSTVVDSSTFDTNHASTASAIVTYSPAGTNKFSMLNSTVSDNVTAPGAGSLVLVHAASIVSSTIAGNTAASGRAGIYVTAATGVAGSIISGNGAGCGIVGGFVAPTDGGYNLADAGDSSCGFSGANNDLATDPQLGALANNGGPTKTRGPAATSPVLNVIPPSTATALTNAVTGVAISLCAPGDLDQRGVARPDGAACDIGSVEVSLVAPTINGPSDITFVVGSTTSFDYTTMAVPAPAHVGIGGTLPSGITFTDNGDGTAAIAGNAASGTGGTYNVTLTATNGVSPNGTLAIVVHVTQAPTITGPSSAIFVAGRTNTVNFSSAGFPTPTLSNSGPLPTGVTFTPHADGTATISGNPPLAAVGSYAMTLTATNGTGTPATLPFTLIVNKPVSIVTSALPNGQVGVPYNAHLTASGGLPPYSWVITSGSLPAGLSLATDGTVSGSPTANAGTTTFTVRVTDSLHPAGSVTRAISITIDKGPTFLAVSGVVLKKSGKITTGTAQANLTGGSPALPISGQIVVFKSGSTTVCQGTTAADGNVSCSISAANTVTVISRGGVTGTYAGNAKWAPSSGQGGIIS